jgi:serine/threonine-protein phosphatase 2A regulatory subunit B
LKKGKYVAARDYLNVKIWDVCNPAKPLMTVPVQESIKSKLCDLFENDSIYDKFSMFSSEDGS